MQVTFLGCGGMLVVCGFLGDAYTAYVAMVLALFLYGACQSGQCNQPYCVSVSVNAWALD